MPSFSKTAISRFRPILALGLVILSTPETFARTATIKKPSAPPDPPLVWNPGNTSETAVTLEGDQPTEGLGLTVQLPAVASGQITTANANQAALKPMSQDSWRQLFLPGRSYFLEVDGPQGHPWCGHRIEIDEMKSSKGDTRSISWEKSPLNTRLPEASLAKATFRVRPHVTLPMMFSRSWTQALAATSGSGEITCTLSRPSGGTDEVKVTRNRQTGALIWTLQGRTVGEERLLMPPGSGLFVSQPGGVKVGFGLQGETRTYPCRSPLVSGWNLLSYPFAKDLRLGLDWGAGDAMSTAAASPVACDRIVTILAGQKTEYALWASPQGPRWRKINPLDSSWQQPAEYLEKIPTGCAFLLFRQKPNPHHVFLPPAP